MQRGLHSDAARPPEALKWIRFSRTRVTRVGRACIHAAAPLASGSVLSCTCVPGLHPCGMPPRGPQGAHTQGPTRSFPGGPSGTATATAGRGQRLVAGSLQSPRSQSGPQQGVLRASRPGSTSGRVGGGDWVMLPLCACSACRLGRECRHRSVLANPRLVSVASGDTCLWAGSSGRLRSGMRLGAREGEGVGSGRGARPSQMRLGAGALGAGCAESRGTRVTTPVAFRGPGGGTEGRH